MSNISIGIYGGSGYGGSELLRILLSHPNVEISFVTANEQAGKRVADVHKNLEGVTDLVFSGVSELSSILNQTDAVFLALPHGQAPGIVAELPEAVKVIDLSGDFRIDDEQVFEDYYKLPHPGITQRQFVYGLTETNREMIKGARYISNPGCFATAALLALAPIAKSGLITGRIVVDAKTGSSGSGVKPAANTHHPQRSNSFYAYKPFTHQHRPEIEQHLRSLTDLTPDFTFMTHSMPVSRGVFASCYLETQANLTNEDLKNLYLHFYDGAPFIRLVDGSPDINWVKTTNFCDIAVHSKGNQVVIFSAIDNLVKGAAGQAVQNMNLMFGYAETAGLRLIGTNP